jgi:hypothetical protein
MIPVLSIEETQLISGLNTNSLALLASKIANPSNSFSSLAKYVYPELSDSGIKDVINRTNIAKAYKLVIDNPWIAGQLMLTSLYPYAIGTLLLISVNPDERSNVRVTAAKELVRLGALAELKLAQQNERSIEPTSELSDLFNRSQREESVEENE